MVVSRALHPPVGWAGAGALSGSWRAHCAQAATDVALEAVQLFGGNGYMAEYPIAQLYADARVSRVYGGASEVMKLIIARTL